MKAGHPIGSGRRHRLHHVTIRRKRQPECRRNAELCTDLVKKDVAAAGATGDSDTLSVIGDLAFDGIADRFPRQLFLVGREARLRPSWCVNPVTSEEYRVR